MLSATDTGCEVTKMVFSVVPSQAERWEYDICRGLGNLANESASIEEFSKAEAVLLTLGGRIESGLLNVYETNGSDVLRALQYDSTPAAAMITGIYR